MNELCYGDNLDVLRMHVAAESVDLIYLDPPFNSNASYNVLFSEQSGAKAAAQIKAFEDTWRWDQVAAKAYQEVVEAGGKVSEAMQAFHLILGDSNMLAYLAMMAPRLVELRRVLKPTGSIYLHCDPTASHYLKLLMDAVFGPALYVSEVIWKRTSSHNDPKRPGRIHDVIFIFCKGTERVWNPVRVPLDQSYVDKVYVYADERGRYRLDNLTAPHFSPTRTVEWRGARPAMSRQWRFSFERLEQLLADGRIQLKADGTPSINGFKRYLDDGDGTPIQSIWDDIPNVTGISSEKLGYPTQKPEALLERIIQASSSEGDVVLDPFCGCGTAVAVAQRLNRRWIGIDITHLAVTLMKARLKDAFGDKAVYKVIGEPTSLPDAEALAASDPYQFQWWALGLVGARPVDQKKGADKGIDGRIYFHDEGAGSKTKQVILSVKAGHTNVAHVRDLRGVIEREKAEIGVLITMQAPTGPMKKEAASAGFYHSPGWNRNYAKLQILTVEDLLSGKGIDMPPMAQVSTTFKKAPKVKDTGAATIPLELG